MRIRCIENDVSKLVESGRLSKNIGGPDWYWKQELEIGKEYVVYGIVKFGKVFGNVKGDDYRYLTCINNLILWRSQAFFEVSDSYLGMEWYYNSQFTEIAKKITDLEFVMGYKELATDPDLQHYMSQVERTGTDDIFYKRKVEFDEYNSFLR